jgi:hypothetical protein
MRQVRWVVGGVILAVTLAGCGESPPESGTVEFKATNSPEIEALTKRMSENAKGKTSRKPEAASKPSESKAASDAKAETK